ncbi:MAG: hypothetical protein JSV39_04640 [Candidatus Aenigmatarchaeota archaeon]|nr:MAG: hypothetical protein JSV39_04640 [Candidatus Aenigmarchaeota archaeon]
MKIIKIYGLVFAIFIFLFLNQPAKAVEWELEKILNCGGYEIYVDEEYIYGGEHMGWEEEFIHIWYKNNMNLKTKLSKPYFESIYADDHYIYAVTFEIANLTVWYKNNMSLKVRLENPPFFFKNIYVDDDYIYAVYGNGSVLILYKDNLTIMKDLNSYAYKVRSDGDFIYVAGGSIYIWYKNNMSLAKVLGGMGRDDIYLDEKYIYGLNKDIFIIQKNNLKLVDTIKTDYDISNIHIDDDYIYGVSDAIYVWYKDNFTLSTVIANLEDIVEINYVKDIYTDGNCVYVGAEAEFEQDEDECYYSIFVWCKKETGLPKPQLLFTEVENLFGEAFGYASIVNFLTGQYINALVTAWVSNDDVIGFVNSNFSAPSGFLSSDVVPMDRVEEGEYSRIIVAQSVQIAEIAFQILIPYLKGTSIGSLVETEPEIEWDYVIIGDVSENLHPYRVGKRLPTVLDTFPNQWTGRATMIISACPVDMLVTDPEGRRTGTLYGNGEFSGVVNEINKSVYSGTETEPEFVVIFDPIEGEYRVEIYGNETGTYNLSIVSVDNGSVFYEKNYTNISINQDEMQEFEEPITDVEPPEAIISYDPVSEDLIIRGKDNYDKNVSVIYEEICSKYIYRICIKKERYYVLTDDAGNQLILTMRYNKINRSYKSHDFSLTYIRLLSTNYTTKYGFNEIRYKRNWLNYNIYKNLGKIKRFSQNIYIKNKGFIRASYNAKKNTTLIVGNFKDLPKREALEGLHFYDMITDLKEGIKLLGN